MKTNDKNSTKCPDCNAEVGEYHRLGCPQETCSLCGKPVEMCKLGLCRVKQTLGTPWQLESRLEWEGEPFGYKECREYGWFKREDEFGKWVPCDASHPEASPDIGRVLFFGADWSFKDRRFHRTNFSQAIDDMDRLGTMLLVRVPENHIAAHRRLRKYLDVREEGEEIPGYAYYTTRGLRRMKKGKDFNLYTRSFEVADITFDDEEFEKDHPKEDAERKARFTAIVEQSLTRRGVRFTTNPDKPGVYRIAGDSIVTLHGLDTVEPLMSLAV